MPGAEGEAWSQLTNEALLAAARAEPRFVPLASVPLGDGARAAAVLRAAMAAGFAGAMIGTLPRGVGSTLDVADLDPFWAAADETGALIHIHPSFDAGDVRVNDFGLANGLGRITDAAVAVARLISAGHLAKYKNAKFFAPMGGAALPFVLGRLKRNAAITPGIGDPVEGLAHLYTDTILHDARVLEIRDRDDGQRAPDDGLRHAVPDRRYRAACASSPTPGSPRRRPIRSMAAWRHGCSGSHERAAPLTGGGRRATGDGEPNSSAGLFQLGFNRGRKYRPQPHLGVWELRIVTKRRAGGVKIARLALYIVPRRDSRQLVSSFSRIRG